jgi:hypothetical protein
LQAISGLVPIAREQAPTSSTPLHEKHDQPEARHHDVPPVFHLGSLVHLDRRLHDSRRHGELDPLALHREPAGGHRGALLCRSHRGSLLRHGEGACRAAPARRRPAARRAPARGQSAGIHPRPPRLQPLLHADARPRELACVSSHPGCRETISAHPRLRHRRLDCGGPGGFVCPQPVGRRRRRGHSRAASHGGRCLATSRCLLPHPTPHPAFGAGPEGLLRLHPRTRCLPRTRQRAVLRFPREFLPDLHPARRLLQLHPAVPRRRGSPEHRGSSDARPDVGSRLHAGDAALLCPARGEMDARRRHVGVGGPLCPLRHRGAGAGASDDHRWNCAARGLL